MSIDALKANVEAAKKALEEAQAVLAAFHAAPENNTFDTLDDAQGELEDLLYDRAYEDCEGAFNCGDDEYRQGFYVGGIEYVAIATFEYNRHDKTYYYIDGSEFRIEKVEK